VRYNFLVTRSVLFDGRFLGKSKNGISRDSREILQQLKNEGFKITLLVVSNLEIDAEYSEYPQYRIRFLKLRLIVQFLFFKRTVISKPNFDFFFLCQVFPLRLFFPNKCQTVIRIHDIFPITNPEWFRLRSVLLFKYSMRFIKSSDLLLTNSRNTFRDLEQYFPKRFPKKVVFPCLVSIPVPTKACKSCELCLNDQALPISYMLLVSTVEPRKNYGMVLAWWERYYKKGMNPLVILGNPGWKSKPELIKILQLQQKGAVIRLENICDAKVFNLYGQSNALISISSKEGFNYPIHEAMLHGKSLIVSDTAIHRELIPEWYGAIFIDLKGNVQSQLTNAVFQLQNDTLRNRNRFLVKNDQSLLQLLTRTLS